MLTGSSVAHAGIQISPLLVSFSAQSRAQQINVRNTSTASLTIQVRLFEWSQPAENGMILTPTSTLTASPTIVTLPPGGTQLVRVLRRQALPNDQEHYFRLLLDELPDASSAASNSVQMLTRYSVPVFIAPRLAGQPELSASLVRCTTGEQYIHVRNAGSIRSRLTEWQLLSTETVPPQQIAQGKGLTGYVLAGGGLRIALPKTVPTGQWQWQVATDRREWETILPPTDPTACPSSGS